MTKTTISEIHKTCPRKGQGEAKTFGVAEKCLKPLGCRGPETHSDCPSRKWNNGTNWCIGAGAICIGCTERDFPDKFSPFYKVEYSYEQFDKPVEEEPTDGSLVIKPWYHLRKAWRSCCDGTPSSTSPALL
ncbi:MAG: hypothetical protein GQ542_21080 [Desulforhopalus sp.]|nr:hypothetical protein [Desulforhopalus sp.]